MTGKWGRPGAFSICPLPLFGPTRSRFFLHREQLTTGTRTSGLTRRAAVRRRLVTVPRAPPAALWAGRDGSSARCFCMHSPQTGGAGAYLSFPSGLRGRTLLWTWAVLDRAAPAHWARTAASVGGGSAPCLGAGLGAAALQLPQWLQA